jgi:uncharacterized damage-inducible protein DinB
MISLYSVWEYSKNFNTNFIIIFIYMKKKDLTDFFERDLKKLVEEISLYKDDESLWIVKPGISNSAGNLSLHLIGNLNHFIGAILGNTGFIRERDKEFSSKNISRNEIISELKKTIQIINNTLAGLSGEDLEVIYPLEMFGKKINTSWMLIHLITHLNYHLGQINYHRRFISG